MLTLRSLVFTSLLFASAILGSALVCLLFWAPFRAKWAVAEGWARFCLWTGDFFCGLDVVTEGAENIPDEPCYFFDKAHDRAGNVLADRRPAAVDLGVEARAALDTDFWLGDRARNALNRNQPQRRRPRRQAGH